ncbi:hypothetical protein GCM10023187_44260 [Nibrella viscosa]|uniref:Lipoprotein n=1 Tax=Nibrella viscosa TaxID=1084524 RepID=A0ABP8KT77_9BACT
MKKLIIVLLLVTAACAPRTQIRVPDGGFQDYFKSQRGQALISVHRGGGNYKGYSEACVAPLTPSANKQHRKTSTVCQAEAEYALNTCL